MPNGEKTAPKGQEPSGTPSDKTNTKRLTDKEKLFVAEYLKDFNATRAATDAGYSKKSARQIGAENLSKPHIQEQIQKAHEARIKRLEKGVDDVARELAIIGFARMGSYAQIRNGRLMFMETEALVEDGLDAAIESYTETVTESGGSTGIKLHNKIKALELYGKHIGMWKEKADGHGENVANSQVDWDKVDAAIQRAEKAS